MTEKHNLIADETSASPGSAIGAVGTRASDVHAEEIAGRERLVSRLRRLWDRRRTVLRFTGVGLALAIVIAFLIPKQFMATAHLMPPDQANSGAGLALLASSASNAGSSLGSIAGGLLGLKSSGALFIGILQSRTVQDDIVGKFNLRKVYGVAYAQDARLNLAANSSIFEDRKSGILTIQVTDSDPQRAAGIAQEYTAELDRVVNRMSTSSAHREREFLEERLKAVQLDLADAEKQFSEFSSKNAAIDIQAQGKAMIEGAATLEGQLIAAESELEGLKQVYSNDNVRVRSVFAQIAQLKKELAKIGGNRDGAASAKEGTSGESSYPSIRKLPLLGVTYADLYRRTRVQEAVFETLTREYELAKVQEVKETPSVKVLDPATVPEHKSFPPRKLIVLLGTCIASVMGMAWLILQSFWDETDPEDPLRALAAEIYRGASVRMAQVPAISFCLGTPGYKFWARFHGRARVSQQHD